MTVTHMLLVTVIPMSTPSTPPAYVSAATAAAQLDMAESTFRDYVRRGLLPRGVSIGACVRWRWADLEAHIIGAGGAGAAAEADPLMGRIQRFAADERAAASPLR